MIVTAEKKKLQEIKVVIVEDYKLTRVGLRTALNDIDNIRVVGEAEKASEGLEIIAKTKPDIVLMDLGLTGMNGIEATQKIREDYPDIKIVVLTSHERDEEVIAALSSGASSYCLKDIDPISLASVIKTTARGACWLAPQIAKVILNLCPRPKDVSLLTQNTTPEPKLQLTERELEVLTLLVDGKSNSEIAAKLFVSVHTAKAHVCSILQKLCVDDRVQAAVRAVREHLV